MYMGLALKKYLGTKKNRFNVMRLKYLAKTFRSPFLQQPFMPVI